MTMAEYCKNKGMDLQGYKQYESNIKAAAMAIIQGVKANYKTDTGMYYNSTEILGLEFRWNENTLFIIQVLKQNGVEFIENNKLWRF